MTATRHAEAARDAVIEAAVKWWESHLPVSFDEKEHLKHPWVNTTTAQEKELAVAVASLRAALEASVEPASTPSPSPSSGAGSETDAKDGA